MGVTDVFKVSTNYIWELSKGAVKELMTSAVDVEILNRLLEHKNFPT